MVHTIRVWYVPYEYGIKYAYGTEQYHRKCVGVSKCAYIIARSINLHAEAANPLSGQQPTNQATQQLLATPIPVSTTQSAPAASTKSYPDRKFNVVLFGLAECPKGTKKFSRDKSDHNNATAFFQN